jgi:hypothetical protein
MSQKCISFINQLKGETEIYEKRHTEWRNKLAELIRRKDTAYTNFNNADIALANTEPTERFAIDYCGTWSDGTCGGKCTHYRKTTPGGRVSKYGYHRPSSQNSGCLLGRWNCMCIVPKWDDSGVILLKTIYDDLEKQISTHILTEPSSPLIDVSCCENVISCSGGRCIGNIQQCQSFVYSKITEEEEMKVFEGIQVINNLLKQLVKNFNSNITELEGYYINFQELLEKIKKDKNLNINLLFLDMKILYKSAETSYNIIYSNMQGILNYYLGIIENNGRIKATSSLKPQIRQIINEVKTIVDKATSDFDSILKKYDEIKNFWESLELQKNNLDSMNINKILIDNNISNINIDIENINKLNTQVNSLIIKNDTELETLLKLVDNMNNLFNQIINNRETINKLFNEIKILFNTIPPQSIFFNNAIDILTVSDNTNILVNNKFTDIQNIINNINNIGKNKKTNYEKEKKINEDYKKFNTIQEEEKKINSDLLLLELIKNK